MTSTCKSELPTLHYFRSAYHFALIITTALLILSSTGRAARAATLVTPLGQELQLTPMPIQVGGGPRLLTQENSTRATALDFATWRPEPFQLVSPTVSGSDNRTRIVLFAMNLKLLPGEDASAVMADAEDGEHRLYPLTVEYVGKVPGLDWLNYVVIRLNDDMGDVGDVLVRVYLGGTASNRVRIGVGHIGGGPADDESTLPLTPAPSAITSPATLPEITPTLSPTSSASVESIAAATSSNLPSSWVNQDIGDVILAGSAEQSNGTFTVTGSGADIWGNSDEFQYAYQPLTGDGEIVARVASFQNTDPWAKAGVMIRETLAAGSAHAMMVVTANNGVSLQRRTRTGAASEHTTVTGVMAPTWVKLVRSGNNFSGYRSSDGMNWVLVSTLVINMTSNVYVGLAVTAHNSSTLNYATFDQVSAVATGNSASAPFAEQGGRVVMEAENYHAHTPRSNKSWTARQSPAGYVGAGMMVAEPNSGTSIDASYTTTSPEVQYKVQFATAGTYYVWLRAHVDGSADNSIHVGLDGQAVASADRMSVGTYSNWTWARETMDGPVATLVVGSPGLHTINVWMREDGIRLDRLILTTDSQLSPSGQGPAENPRAGTSLPSPWSTQDVGSVGVAGTASYSAGTFTVKGSGVDIWETSDGFRYMHQPLSGNGEVVARVASVQNTDPWAKAGVMIRETLAANSKQAMMVVSASNGISFQRRAATGGTTTQTTQGGVAAPHWVKVVRSGDTLIGYGSSNGTSWTEIGRETITMSAGVQIGLVVTSHNNGVLNTSTFDNVSVTAGSPAPTPTPTPTLTPTPTPTPASTPTATPTPTPTPTSTPTPTPTPSATWTSRDIGNPGIAGSGTQASGTFTVRGSGSDIWDKSDQFQYLHQPLNGDGQIIARVVSVQNTDLWAKAGVMIRETLAADSRHASLFLTSSNGLSAQGRVNAGGISINPFNVPGSAPRWLKLIRRGSIFDSFQSSDGVNWASVGTMTIDMTTNPYIGLAVTSHNASALNTSTFDNVSVQVGSIPELAKSADAFVESIGVNTHLNHPNQYADLTKVKDKLLALGVRHIRDSAFLYYNQGDADNYGRYKQLAALGIFTTAIVDPRSSSYLETITAADIAAMKNLAGNSVEMWEGPNELDISGDPNYIPKLQAYQRDLYAAVKNNPSTANMSVLGPSIVGGAEWAKIGSLGPYLDFGNIHSYPNGRVPTNDLNQNLQNVRIMAGTKPVMSTETGYHNAINQGTAYDSGVSYEAGGKYMPRLLLTYFNYGIVRTFQFQLLDAGNNPSQSNAEEQYGLIKYDWTDKPAYTSIKNLIGVLKDPGPAFTPQSLSYSLSGNVANIQHTLLQKRDGKFYLILWQEVPSWQNAAVGNNISVAPRTLTVNLGTAMKTAKTYLPYQSATVQQTFNTPTQLTLSVPDHPLVIELMP